MRVPPTKTSSVGRAPLIVASCAGRPLRFNKGLFVLTKPSLSSLPFLTRSEDDGEVIDCFCLALNVEVGSTARAVGIDGAILVRFGRGMAQSQ